MKVKNSIPTGWRKVTLNEVGTSFNGLTGKKKDDFGNGEPYINYKSVFNNEFIGEDDFSYVKVSKDESQNIVSYGDILITVSSETPEDIGMSSVYLGTKKTYLNSFCFGIKPKQTIDPVFSAYWLRSSIARKSIVRLAQGSTRFNLSKIKFMDIELPLPSLPEQKKIADILSTVDKKIDLIDKKIAETEKLKTGLMQKLFSEGVGVQDENGNWQPHTEFQDSPFGKIPKCWSVEALGEHTIKVGSGVTPKGGSKAYVDTGIPLIRSQNVLFGKFKLDDVAFITEQQHEKMKGSQLKPKDVLLNITGASIGRCAVLPADFEEGNVNQHVCIIRMSQAITPEFCGWFLNSNLGQKQIWNLQAGGNREGLNFQQIRSFRVPVLTVEEQCSIVEILSTVSDKLNLLEQQKAETQQLKKGLMQKLLTGEWRVPAEETEAA
ncbi:MAG: restriction endonuclease subunit S [Vibrio anguillarum]|nr:restriction endonuclease subunit S [Vibrio anguillarum]